MLSAVKRYALLSLLFYLVLESTALAQVDTAWVRRYNGPANDYDQARALAVDNSGNVYVTGSSGPAGPFTHSDYATIKYAANGDTLWVRLYNGSANFIDGATALAVDNDGNVYVCGGTEEFVTGHDYTTIKYAPDGDTLWVRRYVPGNLSEATALAVDNSGNVYVTGQSYQSGDSLGANYATIKYAPNGDAVWVSRYEGLYDDYATALAVDGSGNVYVTGNSLGIGSLYDYATIKYASNGDAVWVRRYNGPGNNYDVPTALAVDNNGNVYVTGHSDGGPTTDYATIKYSPDGATLWVRRYNGPGNGEDGAYALAVDGSGNVYVTGGSLTIPYNGDYTTIKYAPNGDTLWVRRYNGPGAVNASDAATALAVDDSGNVYVTGNSTGVHTSHVPYSDYATIKYSSSGDILWVITYNGPGNQNDLPTALVVDGSGNVYVTGRSWSGDDLSTSDYATIKYTQSAPPLTIQAFSPVDLIVVDPNNDSIGVSFNTISGASYSVSNDSIHIGQALAGNYRLKVILDTLDLSGDTTYDLSVKIGSAASTFLASNRLVPGSGQTQAFSINVNLATPTCFSKPGDANASSNYTLADLISILNYIFNKPGCSPQPLCWLSGLLCRGDWNGSGTVSVADVIAGLHYLFGHPGGPWTPVPTGACCQP